MSNLVLENDSNESFPINYICTSSDIKVPIGTEPVMDCVGICKKAGEFEDIEDGKNYIREKYSKCGFGEDVIQHGINALVNSKKVNESVFDSDRCLIKLKSIQFDNIYEVKRAKQARSFIDEEIFNKDGDKINKKLFITNELYNHLTLSK